MAEMPTPKLAQGQKPGVSTPVRDNAYTLSDFRTPTLSIECEPCGQGALWRGTGAKTAQRASKSAISQSSRVLAAFPRRE